MERVQSNRSPMPFARERRWATLKDMPQDWLPGQPAAPSGSSPHAQSQSPGVMGLSLPWLPMMPQGLFAGIMAAPSSQFGVGFSNPDGGGVGPEGGVEGGGFGGGGSGGGGTSSNPLSTNYLPPWPHNNVFMAEILGWERAVPPPVVLSDPDPYKWIWKYRWREVRPNRLWTSHQVRSWDSNPGLTGPGGIHAYNGCEYANYSATHPADARRPFAGPFSFNLEEPDGDHLPFVLSAGAGHGLPQAVQDYTLFTDFTDMNGEGPAGGRSVDLPLWEENQNPAVKLGQPLPIGHHGGPWKAEVDGYEEETFAWDMGSGVPNVRVLMMEQWIRVADGGLAINNPEFCPDCDALGTQAQVQFGDDPSNKYVCTYWFHATNARLDMPWVPSRSGIGPNWVLRALLPTTNGTPTVPYYAWTAP